jgi:glycosyltransferase involved in cell wall biosynthesis
MTPTVTVVIPAWRAAETIARAVRSVLAQSVPVLEVLVVDDGSPDDIAAALAGFPESVRVIRQPNGGASAARNRGLDEARGEWIAFLDADDEWLPGRLERQFEAVQQHPEVRFVASKYLLRPLDGADKLAGPLRRTTGRVLRLEGAEAFDFAVNCWTGAILIHNAAIGVHRFRTDLRTAEDREFWLRMVLEEPAFALAEPLAIHHVRANSLSNSDIDDDCRNMLRLVELHASGIGPEAVAHWRAVVHRRAASVHLAEGRRGPARKAAFTRLRLEPLVLEAWWILLRTLVPGMRR